MKIDMVVIRHASPGAPNYLARKLDANIINAGDGRHEHPTQALLDMYSIKESAPPASPCLAMIKSLLLPW